MTTSDPETTTLQAAPADSAAEPKATTKAHTAPRKPRVAPTNGKSGKKTTQGKNAPKTKKAPKPKKAKASGSAGQREGSKTAEVVTMLQWKGGATLQEIMDKMRWQKHTVRGFMAGP